MCETLYGIDLKPFFKARQIFEEFRLNLKTDQDKAGAIQSFEFCFELSWKTMKRLLQKKGIDTRSPRDYFREAAQNGMIKNVKDWFSFIDKQNLTIHTYDMNVRDGVIKCFCLFSNELTAFVGYLHSEHQKSTQP